MMYYVPAIGRKEGLVDLEGVEEVGSGGVSDSTRSREVDDRTSIVLMMLSNKSGHEISPLIRGGRQIWCISVSRLSKNIEEAVSSR